MFVYSGFLGVGVIVLCVGGVFFYGVLGFGYGGYSI